MCFHDNHSGGGNGLDTLHCLCWGRSSCWMGEGCGFMRCMACTEGLGLWLSYVCVFRLLGCMHYILGISWGGVCSVCMHSENRHAVNV